MSRHFFNGRRTSTMLGILVVMIHAQFAHGQTFVTDNNGSGDWYDNALWTGTPPNSQGAAAQFNMPITTGPASNGYTLNINTVNTTIGSINIDNTTNLNTFVTRICGASNCTGKIIFDNGANPATYTENAGTPNNTMGESGRFIINPAIDVLSNLTITQDNQSILNTPTEFTGLISGASGITITKNGLANLQLTNNLSLFPDEGFFGQYVINAGGIRMLGKSGIRNSSGVTVNAGGQLQLADNAGTAQPLFEMATGALLKLNGLGKTTGNSADGALRFGIQAGRTTTFSNPVVLESDARINVAGAGTFGIIDEAVSGPGDLIMISTNLTGKLTLSSQDNAYTGDTDVRSGTLSITDSYLADAADVYLRTGATFDLSFLGTDTIRSLFLDGVAQAIGVYGAGSLPGNGANGMAGTIITGTGQLNVTALPGLLGDHNEDGVVDAADYAAWAKDPGAFGGAQGYIDWSGNFGDSESGAGGNAAVPEPTTALLLLIAAILGAICRRQK